MDSAELPDDLPPVKPPSVGFIFQLFVVPALIVAAVVAVWVLFGKLASGEQNWENLISEISSPNRHIRYRAMTGLAQVLDTDRRLGPKGRQLSQNSRIAQTLADELNKKLASTTMSDETLNDAMFLTRALGSVDQAELAVPPLIRALDSSRDEDVRKSAITSLAFIAGRALEQKSPLTSEPLSDAVIEFSRDGDPHLRRAAAFTLGLIESPQSLQRLEVLAEDADWMTAVNAAVALSRRGSPGGFEVLKQIFSGKTAEAPEAPAEGPALELTIYHNAFKAASEMAGKWSPEQQAELVALLTKLADDHPEIRVRTDARSALAALKK